MKRPSFQFYPADWRNNAKLRRCSEAARGAWMDVLCILHDSDEYGVCRWPLSDLARAAGVPVKLLSELVGKDVLKGADGPHEAYVYTPRHAGRDGDPVVLVPTSGGPCWYSSRLVRDEWVRQRRGGATRFGQDQSEPIAAPKPTPRQIPKSAPMPPIGSGLGHGSTSTSTSSVEVSDEANASSSPPRATGKGRTPAIPCPYDKIVARYHEALPMLPRVKLMPNRRKAVMRMTWAWVLSSRKANGERRATNADQALTWFADYFAHAASNDFLTGRAPRSPGHEGWKCDIDFLLTDKGMKLVIEKTEAAT